MPKFWVTNKVCNRKLLKKWTNGILDTKRLLKLLYFVTEQGQ